MEMEDLPGTPEVRLAFESQSCSGTILGSRRSEDFCIYNKQLERLMRTFHQVNRVQIYFLRLPPSRDLLFGSFLESVWPLANHEDRTMYRLPSLAREVLEMIVSISSKRKSFRHTTQTVLKLQVSRNRCDGSGDCSL